MTIKELLDGVKEVLKRAVEENQQKQTELPKADKEEQPKAQTELPKEESSDDALSLPKKKTYETPEYSRLDEKGVSDEQLADIAKGDLYDYATTSRNAINSAYEKAVENADKSKKNGEDALKSAVEATKAAYEEAKRNLNDAMIRRGLSKSSIAATLERDVDLERARKTSEAAKEYADSVAKLDDEIARAESERDAALKNFDIEYAVKYAKRVAELTKERDEKREAAIKYNNTIAKQTVDDEINADKESSKLYGTDLDNVNKVVAASEAIEKSKKQDDEDKALSLVRYMLSKMTRAQAAKALTTDKVYAENLTAKQYAALLDEYGVRA
jgi:hypothetical protein